MPKFNKLKIKEVRKETEDCVSIAFELPEELQPEYRFTQGQHLTLKKEIEGEELRRSYSICASPFDQELRIAVKRIPEGRFSTFANEELKVGDALEVMAPMGRFYTELDPENEKNYVAFAAGSGITPIMSIMRAVLQREPKSEFTLFYGNREVDSIIFREQIEGLKNEYMDRLSVHHILSREQTGSELFTGRIDEEKCRAFCRHLIGPEAVDEFFLCGPESMIHAIRDTLMDMGVSRRKIHFELFTAGLNGKAKKVAREEQRKPTADVDARVEITLDGSTLEFPLSSGDSILDAAQKAGADLPFACKGGVCATCRAKLVEGTVDMDVNYALEPDELEAGYILTCQAHPQTDKVVVDFDS